jgi:hypothetical protein
VHVNQFFKLLIQHIYDNIAFSFCLFVYVLNWLKCFSVIFKLWLKEIFLVSYCLKYIYYLLVILLCSFEKLYFVFFNNVSVVFTRKINFCKNCLLSFFLFLFNFFEFTNNHFVLLSTFKTKLYNNVFSIFNRFFDNFKRINQGNRNIIPIISF